MRLFADRLVISFNFTTPRIELFLYGLTKTHSRWQFLNVGLCVGDKILPFSYQRAEANHLPIFSNMFLICFYFFTFMPLLIYGKQKHGRKLFEATIIHKISETNSSLYVE